ncbi:LysR family transcriptional regulator [Streptomyces sp. NPDC089799]|uniref:LysR family transcriptional regulator n=1 Tax=Streptomyces sp. NPDC089799 TaxID=3155066 RepID=UPI0034249C27
MAEDGTAAERARARARAHGQVPDLVSLDMNLLVALDALLEEESVTGAAERMRVTPPAMSRTLGRLRRALGDPVLVRAGRRLVPTPRALELRPRVHAVVRQARELFAESAPVDPATLTRQFNIQASDPILTGLAPALIAAVAGQAPGVGLRFLPETLEGGPALREGGVDLEIGVLDHTDPETRVEPLAEIRMVAAVRRGHPLAGGRRVTARDFARADHISVSRQGRFHGPVDTRLAELGLRRRVAAAVPGYAAALFLCRDTDLVCLTPAGFGEHCPEALGLHTFEIPLDLPPLTIGMAWHPRNDADPAHAWLRDRVRSCRRPSAPPGEQRPVPPSPAGPVPEPSH